MDLLLIRHSIAEPAPLGGQDAHRPLAEEGRALFAAAVDGLGRLDLRLDVILHSPLLRAVQTADLLGPIHQGERSETVLLARPPGLDLLDALLQASFSGETVAAVGHQPHISGLCSLLLTGDEHYGGQLSFSPGTVAWLRGRPRPAQMVLVGLYPAEALAGLGGVT